jgi:N-acetylneuraminic acid mutarotase
MKHALALTLFAAALATAAEPATQNLPALPKAVSSFGATEAGGYLYVYGGHAGKTHNYDTQTVLGTFHRLKLDGGAKWEELPGGPKAQGLNLVAHKGSIYRAGGMQPRNAPGEEPDNHSLTECARFDPKTNKWEPLPALPAGRSSQEIAVAGDKLVLVGGWNMKGKGNGVEWHDTALVLDLAAAKPEWKSVPQPFKRRALAAVALGSKVYAIGGLTAEGGESRVDIFDAETGKWSEGPDLPGSARAAFSPAACLVNGRIVANTNDGAVYRLTAKGDAWEKVGTSEKKRMVARLVPWGESRAVLVGGAGTDSLEVLTVK